MVKLTPPLAVPSPGVTKRLPSEAVALRLEEVRFRWHPKSPLVLDVERLEVLRGEKVFVKGPSGSGKSTLLSLVAGVVKPEAGRVQLGDAELTKLSGSQRDALRADQIGFIFQMFNLIPYLSVLENVTLPLMFSRGRKRTVEAQGDVTVEAKRLLDRLGLGTALQTRNVTDLSIGQQQRVAAARAILGSPSLLIADEPTSALDADTREAFITLLFEECDRAEMTLLFVSHDGSLEGSFDRSLDLKGLNRAEGAQ